MLEMKDGKKILTTPISAEDLKDIHAGDIVYLNGSMTTCRDVAHRRLVEEGRELPVNVKDAAIFHAGPIIRPLENDKFEMVSVGPTTSMRMEKFEYEFVRETGVRVIIGKGGDVYKRQPLSPVASGSAGHSEETARDNLEEGGDDVKSSCPL